MTQKTDSTPTKWGFKKFGQKVAKTIAKKAVHATLLRFPGGDPQAQVACVYCPELCRFSCPPAIVTGNDAVTPGNKMGVLYKDKKWPGQLEGAAQLWPIYDCTGCGRCTEYCVYEMPVAERLIAARATHPWSKATEVLAGITDAQDAWGDLAGELGDSRTAERRRGVAVASAPKLADESVTVEDAKICHSLREAGVKARWSGEEWLKQDPKTWPGLHKLAGKRWLLHESVWASRRLGLAGDVRAWARALGAAGAQVAWAFHQGRDCIDCGGEGAYRLLFAEQAQAMAREIWGRDLERADGVLCVSARCAAHVRMALGAGVPVVAVEDLLTD